MIMYSVAVEMWRIAESGPNRSLLKFLMVHLQISNLTNWNRLAMFFSFNYCYYKTNCWDFQSGVQILLEGPNRKDPSFYVLHPMRYDIFYSFQNRRQGKIN